MAITLVYKDKDFIAVNKPAGILTHKTVRKEKEETVADWVREHFPETGKVGDNPSERPGVVHRLDRETSGVLIVARNQKFFDYLKSLFQAHKVSKSYLALVWGEMKGRGTIDKPIGLRVGSVKRSVSAKKMKMVKPAQTDYEVVANYVSGKEKFTLVRAFPRTGRTHQIRVHFASIGHPVIGDALYGSKKETFGLARQFLHAESIEFSMFDGRRIQIATDLPQDLKHVLERLNK